MCTPGGWAERTEGVVETIANADRIVKSILTDDDPGIDVEVSSCGDPGTDPKAAWHLITQVDVRVNRRIGGVFYPNGRFEKTIVVEKFIEAEEAVEVLDAFGKKLAIFILEGQVKADDLWHGYACIKEIAVANHLIIIKTQAYIRKKLRLVLLADHVIRIPETNVRCIHAVLHQAGAKRDGKATVFRIAAHYTANAAVEAGEAGRPRLVVDEVATSQQSNPGIFCIQIRPPQGLGAGTVCQADPLRPVGNAKGQILAVSEIIAFNSCRID